MNAGEILSHPHFSCRVCGADNVLEVDTSEGFPQSFVWDCARCCHAHEISVRCEDGELVVQAEVV